MTQDFLTPQSFRLDLVVKPLIVSYGEGVAILLCEDL